MNDAKRICLVMPSWKNREMKRTALATLGSNTAVPIPVFPYPEEENLGWMKGCNLGIKAAEEFDYVLLANDDILAPGICDWARVMLDIMDSKPEIGALGPITMNAMGWAKLSEQNCCAKGPYEVPYISFFFVLLRNEAIKKIGLLDEELPGGDDLDYCLRLKEAGYKIAITPQVFIWHHYAQTGKRVHGEYWDSAEHTERIHQALIKKHGFEKFVKNNYL